MLNKNILMLFFASLLMAGTNSMGSPVEVTLQFKNDNTQGAPVVLTKQPLVDNFDWASSNPEYKAVWNLTSGEKSIKESDLPIKILPGQSTSAFLSYRWNDKGYGLSQYSFNYENRPKEYGCFVTEVRISGGRFQSRNFNRVIASYRQDPTYPDDYLTCYVEKNTNTSFTIHMTSSKNKSDEKNIANDNQRYSQVGDIDRGVSSADLTQPIELWSDDKSNTAFVLPLTYDNHSTPALIRSQSLLSYDFYYRIRLVNYTNQVIVAGAPLFNNWKRFKASADISSGENGYAGNIAPAELYFFLQPQKILPNDSTSSLILNTPPSSDGVAIRMNYHFEGYQESSGCYIIAVSPHHYYHFNQTESALSTYYRFDPSHSDKNLYCFILIASYRTIF